MTDKCCDPEKLWRDLHDDPELTPPHDCPGADVCVWEGTIASAWEHGRQHGADALKGGRPDNTIAWAVWEAATDDAMPGRVEYLVFFDRASAQRKADEYDGTDPEGRLITPLVPVWPDRPPETKDVKL